MENLEIYNQVKTVPEKAQRKIQAGRLRGMTDIKPMWRIEKLTEVFGVCGIGWYTEVLKKEIIDAGDEKVAIVDINLYIKIDGEWSAPIYGTGGSKLIAKESKGLYVSDECFKMAYTDAISVACKSLGMGADVYWGGNDTKYQDINTTTKKEEKKISDEYVKLFNKWLQDKNVATDVLAEALNKYGYDKIEDILEKDYKLMVGFINNKIKE